MKKITALLICLFLAGAVTNNACADSLVTTKLKRGFTNVFTSPAEIPKTIYYHFKETPGKAAKIVGAVPSVLHGTALMFMRMGSGLFDIVTCNLEAPKGGQPILKPDYVWQKE